MQTGAQVKRTTCCVTGHRDIPGEYAQTVGERLYREICRAAGEGYDTFISGFADGADMLFAQCVVRAMDSFPITLEAAIPYRRRLEKLNRMPEARRLLMRCGRVHVISEGYDPYVFNRRNRYMVERSSLVIAVYDGRSGGGTASTMRMAEERGALIRIVPPGR